MTSTRRVTIATVNVNGLPSFYHPTDVTEKLISYPLRHKEICTFFENSHVDIINFQEVFTYRNLRLLRRHLPSYTYVAFAPYIFGPRGALVTFSKIPLNKIGYQSYFSSSIRVDRTALPTLSLLRSTLKGILVLQAESLPLTIINTHLLYNADLDWSIRGRFHQIHEAQLGALTKVVVAQHSVRPTNNIVVAGDLNVETGTDLIEDFKDRANLHDIFAEDNTPSFHNEFMPNVTFQHRIDYLLTNNKRLVVAANPQRLFTGKVKLSTSQDVYLTDHHGLVATIHM